MHLSSDLTPLRRELVEQAATTQRVLSLMDDDARAHLVAARVAGTDLVLYIDSPTWATRLRLQGPGILSQLNKKQFTARRVRIRSLLPERAMPTQSSVGLSENAKKALREAALGSTDQRLKASLLRLSQLRR